MLNGVSVVLTTYLTWLSQIITSLMSNEVFSTLIMIPIVAGLVMLVLGIFRSFLH